MSPSRSWRIPRVLCGKALLSFLDRREQTPDGLLRVGGAHYFAHHRDAARAGGEAGSRVGRVDTAERDDRPRREAGPPRERGGAPPPAVARAAGPRRTPTR